MVAPRQIIEQTVAAYRLAADANLNTAGRIGSVVHLDSRLADEVMVTADLHGNRLTFERLARLADLPTQSRRHLVMQEVCHGGPVYPDTSACMSHLLLEDMANMKVQFGDRFHFILGNHELAELIDIPIMKSSRMLNLMFRCGMQEMYGRDADEVRDAGMRFIQSCPLAVRTESGVFISHSAPERVPEDHFDPAIFERSLTPDDLARFGPVFRLVWGRDFRSENAAAFARTVRASVLVHGHDPCAEGYRVPNDFQVILDSCGNSPSYVIVPCSGSITQHQVIDRIQRV
jgi:hypothetical protein